jgi:hypothetical protein
LKNKILYISANCVIDKRFLTQADIYCDQFNNFSFEDIQSSKGLIIECEINADENGNSKQRTELYGIQYAQKLRRKGFQGKIVFTSFLNVNFIIKSNPQNAIINAIGHGFIRHPFLLKECIDTLEHINSLSDIELYDIQSNYCNRAGIAQEILHRLHGIATDKSFNLNFVKKEIEESVITIGKLFNNDVDEFLKKLQFNNLHQTLNVVDSFCNQIITSSKDNDSPFRENIEKKSWSVLLLDDELKEDHSLVTQLASKVKKVFCCSNYREAEKILENNLSQGLKISLVISDYRLMEFQDGIYKHQTKQGYSFLIQTAKKYPFLGLIALSSLPRKFLFQSFKQMGIRASIYSKKDYFGSTKSTNVLVDDLIRIGQESFTASSRHLKLSSPQWKNYELFYLYHRNSLEYKFTENFISNKAKAYCEDFKIGVSSFNLTAYTTELKGKTKTPENPKAFQEFIDKMICRRTILWFSQYSGTSPIFSPKDIIKFLQGRNFNPDLSEVAATNQINTNLALRLTDFPWNATIEEREWLINFMNVDRLILDQIEEIESKILSAIKEELTSFDRDSQLNTFVNAKIMITNILNKKSDQDISAKFLQKIKNIKNIITLYTSKEKSTKAIKDFTGYIDRIKSRIEKILKAKKQGDLPRDVEKIKKEVIKKARKQFSYSYELIEGIEVSAFLFFADLSEDKMTYSNIEGFASAFFIYHKESMGYVNPFVTISLDKGNF